MVGWRLPRPGLVGKGNKPATMPLTVPVLRVLEAWRGERIEGRLVLRLLTGNQIDRRDAYRMVARIAKGHRHPSAHLRGVGHQSLTRKGSPQATWSGLAWQSHLTRGKNA